MDFLYCVCVYLLDSLGAGNIYKQLLNEIMKVDKVYPTARRV